MRRTLDPKLDIVFKLLLSKEGNERILMRFLTAALQPPQPITSVEVKNPDTPKSAPHDKGAILDLRVRLASGEHVNVEMQLARRRDERKRFLFYWARIYTSLLERGRVYAELVPTIGIFILAFDELDGPDVHSIFHVLNTRTKERFTDALELHVLELPKLRANTPAGPEDPVLPWMRFFAATSDQELEQLAMADPDIREAKEALEELSEDPWVRERAYLRELELASIQRNLELAAEAAAAKGLAEGEAKGLAEGKAKGLAEGEAKGRAEGEAKGAEALRRTISHLCSTLAIALDDAQRGQLAGADLETLQRIVDSVALHHRWPEE